eukprot:Platyproteum_vivax@DN4661_c0_g1_i1.p1
MAPCRLSFSLFDFVLIVVFCSSVDSSHNCQTSLNESDYVCVDLNGSELSLYNFKFHAAPLKIHQKFNQISLVNLDSNSTYPLHLSRGCKCKYEERPWVPRLYASCQSDFVEFLNRTIDTNFVIFSPKETMISREADFGESLVQFTKNRPLMKLEISNLPLITSTSVTLHTKIGWQVPNSFLSLIRLNVNNINELTIQKTLEVERDAAGVIQNVTFDGFVRYTISTTDIENLAVLSVKESKRTKVWYGRTFSVPSEYELNFTWTNLLESVTYTPELKIELGIFLRGRSDVKVWITAALLFGVAAASGAILALVFSLEKILDKKREAAHSIQLGNEEVPNPIPV